MQPVRKLWAMVALLLVFAALAGSRVMADALWLDEELTLAILGGGRYGDGFSAGESFAYMGAIGETSPPLYYVLVALWARVAGWSPLVLRWLSVWFGVLSVAAMYRLGRDVTGTGVISAILAAFAAFHIYYAHEMRVYAMAVFFAVLSVALYWRLLHQPGPLLKAGFVLALACLLYSHYIPAMVAVSLGLVHLLLRPWSKQKIEVLFLFAIAAILMLPWLGVPLLMAGRIAAAESNVGLPTLLRDVVYAFGNGLWVLLPALMLLSLARVREAGVRLLWMVLLGAALLSFGADAAIGYLFHIRFVIALLPLSLALAAVGLSVLAARTHRYAVPAVLAVWIISGVWYTYDTRLMDSLHMHERMIPLRTVNAVTDLAARCIEPDDAVVLYFEDNLNREWINDLTFQYYFEGVPFRYTDLNTLVHLPELFDADVPSARTIAHDTTSPYAERVARYVGQSPAVWLFIDPAVPPVPRLEVFGEALTDLGYSACPSPQADRTLEARVWSRGACSCG